ncbi:MAG TPA: cytochrome c oxidase subunit 3 [Candidatus Kapabacteria bacterium]|jgi:heme/copper-type cytochrome/quinol oxidase subunit 3|nr:cytochrome c oxidase subunit 3 [Candidatus Kapabacteria bacterium]
MSEILYEQPGFRAGSTHPGSETLIDNSRFVFLIGLAVDVMLFAGLIGGYFVLRGGTQVWPPTDLPHLNKELIGLSSISLALGAFFLSLTVQAQNRNELIRMRASLIISLIFLTVFLGMNAIEWKNLLTGGLQVRTVFGGIYFLVTGVFHIHILAGMCYILLKYRRTLRWKYYTRSTVSIAHLSYFMYAMLIVWLGIYGVVYL